MKRYLYAGALTLALATPAFAEGEVKGNLIVEPELENALVLAGRDVEVQTLSIRGKVGGDVVYKPKMKNALVLAGRDAKVQKVEVH